ncbi:Wall-associated protein precursor [Intestinimonas butyriciproducens]|uniref:Wall-associated protein n=1 Tax=Intestinimonas butyriciproducens TaxID=1297617 RepID=A0A0S2W418_9FIRM|nr:Wall-associated protein precursor [Intestinimonas butyriciproducens]
MNGVSTSYTYGPDGLRTGKGSVSYVWSGGEFVLEGNTRYFYGLDLIAELTDYEFDEVYYFHDAHGNVVTTSHRAINYTANSALEEEDQGAVQRKPDPSEFEYIFSSQEWYDAFGVRDSSIVKSGFGYCGEYLDRETQNYYLRARYYDPTIGRFLAEDTHWNPTNRIYGDNPVEMSSGPIPDVTAVMQSGNLYAYCANNPVMYVDRDGEIGVLATIAIGAGIGALVSGGLQIFKNIKSGETWTKGLGKALLAGGVSGAISVIPIPGVNAWVVVTVTGAAGNLTGQMIAGEVKSAKDVVSALGAGAAAGIIGKGSADLLSKEFQLYFQTLTRAQQKNILNNIGHITNRELTQIRQAFKQGISSTELDELVSRYGYDVIISAFVSSTTATAIQ